MVHMDLQRHAMHVGLDDNDACYLEGHGIAFAAFSHGLVCLEVTCMFNDHQDKQVGNK
jgi:hypothetical protein